MSNRQDGGALAARRVLLLPDAGEITFEHRGDVDLQPQF